MDKKKTTIFFRLKQALRNRKGSLKVAHLLKSGEKKKSENMERVSEETQSREKIQISEEAKDSLKSFR